MTNAIVVGAGVVGLSAALELRRRGADVTVLEQFALGHTRGSSHGELRITRATYTDAMWTTLVEEANRDDWARLQKDAGEALIQKWDGCFFGHEGGPIEAAARAVKEAEADVVAMRASEARSRFPCFRFDENELVLDDRTAGVIRAAKTMAALARLCGEQGVVVRENTRVTKLDAAKKLVETEKEVLHPDAIVVAPGPFATKLLPKLALSAVPQSVGFYTLHGGDALPVWASFEDELHYGLPDVGAGAKVARHAIWGETDPDYLVDAEEKELRELDDWVRDRFMSRPVRVGAEPCWYTMASNEDFVMDVLAPGVAVGAGLSGHGFKLAPLVGRIVAALALGESTGSATFDAHRARFALAR